MKTNTSIIKLSHSPEFREDLKRLLERNFHYLPQNNVFTDFAPLFHPHNSEHNHLLINTKTSQLIGHIGIWQRNLCLNNKKYPVALIGGVTIDEQYQGQGLFKDFFNEVLSIYENQTTLFVLWSDLEELYSQVGFYEVGLQYQMGEKEFSPAPEDFIEHSWKDMAEKKFQKIKNIYDHFTQRRKNLLYLERDNETWDKIKGVDSARLFLFCPQKEIEGYLFIDKGMDLQGIIHDYACSDEFEQVFFDKLSNHRLWIPHGITDCLANPPSKELFNCLIKPAQKDLFQKLIKAMSKDEILVESFDSNNIKYTKDSKKVFQNLESFLRIFWGPSESKYYHPLYIGGLESI